LLNGGNTLVHDFDLENQRQLRRCKTLGRSITCFVQKNSNGFYGKGVAANSFNWYGVFFWTGFTALRAPKAGGDLLRSRDSQSSSMECAADQDYIRPCARNQFTHRWAGKDFILPLTT